MVQPKRLLHQELGIKLQAVRRKLEEKEAQLKEVKIFFRHGQSQVEIKHHLPYTSIFVAVD